LKRILQVVRDGSDLFLPLKAALVGLVATMEEVERVHYVQDGFLDIAKKIDGFQGIFSLYTQTNDCPPVIQQRLEGIALALHLVNSTILKKTERGVANRALHSLEDVRAVEKTLDFVAMLISAHS